MAVLLIIHYQNQNLPFHKETMFILGLTCLIIGIEQLSHPVVTQYIERLTQPTPPLERRRVVVQGQQLKRLENCAQRGESRLVMKPQLIAIVAALLVVGCGGPSAPDISIHEAAEKGNIEAVKQHLAAGTDVNALDDDGGTPLALAIRSGNTETAALLRKHGAPEPEYVP